MAKKNMDGPSAPRRRTIGPAAERSTAGNSEPRPDPTHDEIAEAAYHRFLRRGAQHGGDFDDWLEAERDLKSPTVG